jgi:hypothetical protein
MCPQILVKFPNNKFHENPFNGSRVTCGETDRHGEANWRISFQVYFANAPKTNMKMETTCFYETLVSANYSAPRHIPEQHRHPSNIWWSTEHEVPDYVILASG